MKQGSTLQQLAQTLRSIRDESRDIAVPVGKLGAVAAEVIDLNSVIEATEARKEAARNGLAITVQNGSRHAFEPTPWAHGQLAQYADIPKAYYDRIRGENGALLAQAINHGFVVAAGQAASQRGAAGRLLRTHKGSLRALVSTRYRRLDNSDLAEAILPVLADLGFDFNESSTGAHDYRAHNSYELTDRRLYLKVTTPRIQTEIKRGDVVQYGIVISNSDVGAGSVRVEPIILRLVCDNGLIMETAFRQTHLGRNQAGEGIEDLLSDDTKALSDKAFFAQVRDVVQNSAKPEFFEAAANKLRAAAAVPIKNFDLPIIVERSLKEIGVTATEKVKASILDNLADGAHGAGMNKYGLSQAVTFAAGNAEGLSYDEATELERAGSKIIDLDASAWLRVNDKK